MKIVIGNGVLEPPTSKKKIERLALYGNYHHIRRFHFFDDSVFDFGTRSLTQFQYRYIYVFSEEIIILRLLESILVQKRFTWCHESVVRNCLPVYQKAFIAVLKEILLEIGDAQSCFAFVISFMHSRWPEAEYIIRQSPEVKKTYERVFRGHCW